MKTFGVIFIPVLLFAVGRLALGGDPSPSSGAAGLDWQFIINNYGLMPIVAGALFLLVRERDKQIFDVLAKYDTALEKRSAEMKEVSGVMTQMTATLAQLCVEIEKTRVTVYQVRDMAIKQAHEMWEPEVRGNTRILAKDK